MQPNKNKDLPWDKVIFYMFVDGVSCLPRNDNVLILSVCDGDCFSTLKLQISISIRSTSLRTEDSLAVHDISIVI